MRIISIVIYNFSPLPSVIFSAGGAENDYLYLRGAVFLPPAAAKTLANLQSAIKIHYGYVRMSICSMLS